MNLVACLIREAGLLYLNGSPVGQLIHFPAGSLPWRRDTHGAFPAQIPQPNFAGSTFCYCSVAVPTFAGAGIHEDDS